MAKVILLVGSGGFLGSVLRFFVQEWFIKTSGSNFPWGTLVANVLGSFIIGVVYAIVDKQGIFSQEIRLLLAVGFCGGFTTFSSFAMENFNMLKPGDLLPSLMYVGLSVIAGLFMVWLGVTVTKAVV